MKLIRVAFTLDKSGLYQINSAHMAALVSDEISVAQVLVTQDSHPYEAGLGIKATVILNVE